MGKHFLKYVVIFLSMGMVYFTLEVLWRGCSNIIMLFIGGLCSVLIGLLNEYQQYNSLKIYQQSLIGTLIVLIIEFTSGMFFNVYLDLNLWNYLDIWGNLYGQICIPYAILWFLLMPFCIWLDDLLRFKFYNEGEIYTLKDIYLELLNGK